jgi:hypothetical protein
VGEGREAGVGIGGEEWKDMEAFDLFLERFYCLVKVGEVFSDSVGVGD